ALFVFLFILGLTVVLVCALAMHETAPLGGEKRSAMQIMRNYARLLGNRHLLVTSGIVAGSSGSMYTMATLLPYVLMEGVGLTPTQFGLAMAFQTGAFFVGSLIVRYLMRKVS